MCLTLCGDSVEGASSLGLEPVTWFGVWLLAKSGMLLREACPILLTTLR